MSAHVFNPVCKDYTSYMRGFEYLIRGLASEGCPICAQFRQEVAMGVRAGAIKLMVQGAGYTLEDLKRYTQEMPRLVTYHVGLGMYMALEAYDLDEDEMVTEFIEVVQALDVCDHNYVGPPEGHSDVYLQLRHELGLPTGDKTRALSDEHRKVTK